MNCAGAVMNKYKYKDMEYIQNILVNGFSKYINTELRLIALYMRDVLGITNKQERKEALHNFCENHLPDYHRMKYYKVVNSALTYSCNKNNKLITIDSIPILQCEIDYINKQELSADEKKVLLALLVTYKLRKIYFEIKNPKEPYNNLYFKGCTTQYSDLKKVSNIHNKLDINIDIISELAIKEYVQIYNTGTIRLTFIDNIKYDCEKVALEITDYNNIGYWLEWYNGNKRISKCAKCGNVFYKKSNSQVYCTDCRGYDKMNVKTVVCRDCGKEFEIKSKNNTTDRCSECYAKYRKEYYRLKKQEQRQKNK